MIPNKRPVRRTAGPHAVAGEAGKPAGRYAVTMYSLPQIDEMDGAGPPAELSRTIQPKLKRKPSLEMITPSPYASTNTPLLPRSLSVPKVKSKLLHMNKPAAGAKGHSSPRPDSASHDPASLKRHKRGGLSLQMEQQGGSRKPTAGRETPNGALTYSSTPQAGKLNASLTRFAKVPRPLPSSMTPVLSLPESHQSPSSIEELDSAFVKALSSVSKTDLRGLLRVYHKYFAEAIKSSGVLASVLWKLKEGYEMVAEEMLDRYNREVARFQGEIITLQNSILTEVEERKTLMRKFEKLSRENIDLSHACENYESKCNEYQEKLYDIANTKLDHYPPSPDAYKLLLSELENYKGWKAKVMRELKITQSKEKKLVQLVHALKKRGYPVEEVYNSEIRTPVPSIKHSAARVEEEGESERLINSPAKAIPRPANVPALNLEGVEPDLDSESSHSDSYQGSELDLSFRKTISDSSTHIRTEGPDRSDRNKEELKKMSQDFKAFSAALRIGKTVPMEKV